MPVSVKQFLDTVFLGQTDRAWVCSVKSETHSGIRHNAGWRGGRPRDIPFDRAAGWYYSLGLIKPDAARKALSTWDGGTMLVLDDVGEKSVDPLRILDVLGPPTFVVQTSPKSYQWGYVFTYEVKDINLIARLQRAATLAFYPSGGDPGHEPPVQYLRLPGGVNDKDKHTDSGKNPPPPVRLTGWHPERRFDPVLDLAMSLGATWTQTADVSVSTAPGPGSLTTHAILDYIKTDPVLAGLHMLGMVKGPQGQGWIEVECPWKGTHTNRDDRTGYQPERREFKCMHSDGLPQDKHYSHADVRTWLLANLGVPEWEKLVSDCAANAFGTTPPPVTPNPAKPGRGKWRKLDAADTTPAQAELVVTDVHSRGEVSYRVGAPAGGKSAIALAYALAVAYERGDLIGHTLDRAGPVIILSNEDTPDQYAKRARGWRQWHTQHSALAGPMKHEIVVNDWNGMTVCEKADKYSPVTLSTDMDEVEHEVVRLNAALVLIDTQATTFRNIEENAAGDMGAAIGLLRSWAQRLGVSVEILHHTQKAQGSDGGSGQMTNVRGSGAAAGAARKIVTQVGLSEKEIEKFASKAQAKCWIKQEGAKSNHTAVAGLSWWEKQLVPVPVSDPKFYPGRSLNEDVPVYVRRAKQPMELTPVAEDENNLSFTVSAVAEAIRQTNPLRVRRGPNLPNAADVLAKARSWEVADAEKLLKTALAKGLLMKGEHWTQTRNKIAVWETTEAGAKVAEMHAAKMALED